MFKPEGLIIPDCHCFQTKLSTMNNAIDQMSAINCRNTLSIAITMNICNNAKDYYIACLVADLMITLLPGNDKHMSQYSKEFEEIYERIKPLIMQRLEYVDGVVDSMEGKGK